MEYKDIKTADELESWYADKQAILDSHARDYMVPFGFVYHLDCSGYVSFERWNDTLPTAEEQTAFQSIQNGVSTKEIIEHKDEFGWLDRACRDAEEYDLAPCFIVPARKEYMQEQEIMNVRELYPELIGPDGEIIWSDPDFAKQGNEEAAGPDNFPGHEFDDHKNPVQSWISVIPVQMYWKDNPSELVEANFSIEDTYGLAIDEQIIFSGYNENELVDRSAGKTTGKISSSPVWVHSPASLPRKKIPPMAGGCRTNRQRRRRPLVVWMPSGSRRQVSLSMTRNQSNTLTRFENTGAKEHGL